MVAETQELGVIGQFFCFFFLNLLKNLVNNFFIYLIYNEHLY